MRCSFFFVFKQKTAYEMRISDWSSDVCSSDLIECRLDGRPTLIIIDEGWLVLDSPAFAAQLREWLKTLRKKNASVIFATQSLADIETSAIAPAIRTEERRVGKAGVSPCRTRWSPDP